jgi:hypothetical protein
MYYVIQELSEDKTSMSTMPEIVEEFSRLHLEQKIIDYFL